MMLPCSFCVEVCAGTRRIVQAGHALKRGTAEQPQRSNAPKLYIFRCKWPEDFVLTEVIRLGTFFPDPLRRIRGLSPSISCIELKNKAHRLLAGFLLLGCSESLKTSTQISLEDSMPTLHVESMNDLALVECRRRSKAPPTTLAKRRPNFDPEKFLATIGVAGKVVAFPEEQTV